MKNFVRFTALDATVLDERQGIYIDPRRVTALRSTDRGTEVYLFNHSFAVRESAKDVTAMLEEATVCFGGGA